MKNLIYPGIFYIIFLFYLLNSPITSAQSNKTRANELDCEPTDTYHNKKALARIYPIKNQEKINLIHYFYGEKAYHIQLCKSNKKITYRIRLIDPETKYVFWDNKKDSFTDHVNVSFGTTTRINVQIEALNIDSKHRNGEMFGLSVYYHEEQKKQNEIATPILEENPFAN
ncbi:hypothetical protein [Plebeiibacterium sediminum]|uniref:Uncharacterized protein n=1 Tax=Plebeiibacterium sediminum TaxID=2992112 RepID=A0AAE3SFP7_9BACT|nr:hypothetical protein [Plebeiobacterium sediminum]MCW3787486.1 hypothetical protein [Plebeiobacterium sediminum]